MLTRVTVVPRTVRLATPSLTWEPYLYGRWGVEGCVSFPKDHNHQAHGRAASLPRTGPRTALSPPRRPPAGQHLGRSRPTSAAALFPPFLRARKVSASWRQGSAARMHIVPS